MIDDPWKHASLLVLYISTIMIQVPGSLERSSVRFRPILYAEMTGYSPEFFFQVGIFFFIFGLFFHKPHTQSRTLLAHTSRVQNCTKCACCMGVACVSFSRHLNLALNPPCSGDSLWRRTRTVNRQARSEYHNLTQRR